MGGVSATTVEVGGTGGGGGAVIPEGSGASQEVWRSAPVKGEGRGYEQHFTVYSIYEYSNRETTPVNQIRHTQSVCGREYACRTYRYCRRLWYSVLCGSRIYTSIRISVYMAIHCMHGVPVRVVHTVVCTPVPQCAYKCACIHSMMHTVGGHGQESMKLSTCAVPFTTKVLGL